MCWSHESGSLSIVPLPLFVVVFTGQWVPPQGQWTLPSGKTTGREALELFAVAIIVVFIAAVPLSLLLDSKKEGGGEDAGLVLGPDLRFLRFSRLCLAVDAEAIFVGEDFLLVLTMASVFVVVFVAIVVANLVL